MSVKERLQGVPVVVSLIFQSEYFVICQRLRYNVTCMNLVLRIDFNAKG